MLQQPYLMFLGDVGDQLAAKTARGVLDWRPDWCLAQLRLDGCKADLGLPEMSVAEASAKGAKTMLVGVANAGGFLPEHWVSTITSAIESGLHVASGLHVRLSDIPAVADAAKQHGKDLVDVRHPTQSFKTGTGFERSGKRLLAVGTDCSCGKMYTALAIEREMVKRGMKASFRATGQTGILIAGGGVSVDAVVADFISGAVEWLAPANDPDHWDLVEGQGSLFHPAFAGVSLGLLHGAQADALVLCHEPTRTHMRGLKHQPLPEIESCIEANIAAARLTNPNARMIGVSINSSAYSAADASQYMAEMESRLAIPVVDPFRHGAARLVDALI